MKRDDLLGGLLRDLRLAWRSLRRRPGFAGAAVLTLGLGIGATGAVYTVIHAVLLSELPYPEPERLVEVAAERRVDGVEKWPISYLDFRDWREQAEDAVGEMALHSPSRSFHLGPASGGDEVVRHPGEMVAADYFSVLGLDPAVGRWFSPEEDRPPGDRVVVLGHELWRQRFGGDPGAIGEALVLDTLPFTVIGVAPRGFRGLSDEADLFVPLATAVTLEAPFYLEERSARWLSGIARLAPGVERAAAELALDGAARRLEREYAGANHGIGVRLTPLAEAWFGDLEPVLWTLLAGALFVLAIACVNVANLQLVRGMARQGDVAVRTALGARRRHVLRHLLAESALLSLAGGALGLLLAGWAGRALLDLSGYELKSFVDVRVGLGVVAVTLGVAAAAGLASGLAPALAASRADLAVLLREGERGSEAGRKARVRDLLVTVEVALAFALFVGAALSVQGFRNLHDRDLGYRTADVLTARYDLVGEAWAEDPPAARLARRLIDDLEALPGVRSAAIVGPGMPSDDWNAMDLAIEGQPTPAGETRYALRHHVTAGFFETLDIPVVAGRGFTRDDDADTEPAVVVSREMALQYWGSEDAALGRRIRFAPPEYDFPWNRVVGVVENAEHRGLRGEPGPGPDVYIAYEQWVARSPAITNLLIRTDLAPEELAPALRRVVRETAPDLVVYDVRSLAGRLEDQTAADRFLSVLLGLFAALALLLAAVGIYGLLAFAVGARRREIGLRLALGAPRDALVGGIVRRGMFLAGVGVAAGAVAAAVVTRWLASRLHGVEALDPLAYAGAALALFLVAVTASWLPARRAAQVDPKTVLQSE